MYTYELVNAYNQGKHSELSIPSYIDSILIMLRRLALICKAEYHTTMAQCYHCKQEFSADFRVERHSECPNCRRDVRVCANCRHYSPNAHWDCRESIPEAVHDKERRCFCEYFALRTVAVSSAGPADKAIERERLAKMRFESLFRDSPDE